MLYILSQRAISGKDENTSETQISNSLGHILSSAQLSIAISVPRHSLPPLTGDGLVQCRTFFLVPPPQVAEQTLHGDHVPQSVSINQSINQVLLG